MDPETFLEKLQTDEFRRAFVFHGLAKETDEDDADTIQFTHGTRCGPWLAVPVELIESVDVLSVAPCDDHSHPFIRLEVEPPETEEGTLFADLLRSVTATIGRPTTPMKRPDEPTTGVERAGTTSVMQRPPMNTMSLKAGGCNTWCQGGTMFCACRDPNGGMYMYPCGSCLGGPGIDFPPTQPV